MRVRRLSISKFKLDRKIKKSVKQRLKTKKFTIRTRLSNLILAIKWPVC